MPEALEAEKRDALKFTSGIENQKAPSSHHCSGLFFCLFLWLSLWPRERLLNSSCATTNSGGSGVRRTTSPRPRHDCDRIGAKPVPINGERGTITRLATNVRRELVENSPPVFMASFMAKVLPHESHSKKHQ